jgi:GxxExxY protein
MKRHDAKIAKRLKEPDADLDRYAHRVVGAALEVHRTLGPGYLESIYEQALCAELLQRAIPFRRQVPVAVHYKGTVVGRNQLDLLVCDRLIVELKAVEALAPIHTAQMRSYLKATGLMLGLLINFNMPLLQQGVRRIIFTSQPELGAMAPWRHGVF